MERPGWKSIADFRNIGILIKFPFGLFFDVDKSLENCYYVLAFVALDIPFDSFDKAARTTLQPFVSRVGGSGRQ